MTVHYRGCRTQNATEQTIWHVRFSITHQVPLRVATGKNLWLWGEEMWVANDSNHHDQSIGQRGDNGDVFLQPCQYESLARLRLVTWTFVVNSATHLVLFRVYYLFRILVKRWDDVIITFLELNVTVTMYWMSRLQCTECHGYNALNVHMVKRWDDVIITFLELNVTVTMYWMSRLQCTECHGYNALNVHMVAIYKRKTRNFRGDYMVKSCTAVT
jgi:hypothetical protein